MVNTRSPLRAAALASALGATPANSDTIVVCAGTLPSDCHLRKVKALVTFSDPTVTGNTALSHVHVTTKGPSLRMPITRSEKELQLELTSKGWKVTRESLASIS